MSDPYWDAVAKKAEERRANRTRWNWTQKVRRADKMKQWYNPVGRKCTWCRVVITSGGMLNPETPNSQFCSAACYGNHLTKKGK